MLRSSRTVPIALAVTISLAALGACSSGSTTTSATAASSSSSSGVPEEKISTDAEVAAGLAKLRAQAAVVVAADRSAAQAAGDELEAIWKGIEGTIKQKDANSYLTFEEDLTTLRDTSKDSTAKKAAADSLDRTAAAYLAAHPG